MKLVKKDLLNNHLASNKSNTNNFSEKTPQKFISALNDKRKCWLNLASTFNLHLYLKRFVFIHPFQNKRHVYKYIFAEESGILKV